MEGRTFFFREKQIQKKSREIEIVVYAKRIRNLYEARYTIVSTVTRGGGERSGGDAEERRTK